MFIINGQANEFYMSDPFNSRVVINDSKAEQEKRDRFFRKQSVGFGRLLLDDRYDCPICTISFEADHQVIALNCNKKHLYHIACLQDYLEYPGNKMECSLCREPITFDIPDPVALVLETHDEFEKVIQSDNLVVVYFYSDSCTIC